MNPGIVFTSLTNTRPSCIRKKSTRAIPAASIARNAATARRWSSSSVPGGTSAGIVGLVLLAIAFYAALALQMEDARRKTVLPVLRVGAGRSSIEGSPADQIGGVEHEAGVREQL